jgi:hypothetical protein
MSGIASLVPPELARERGPVLHRALRHLPLALLEPLLNGLRRHADSLIPGRLYGNRGSEGCAVGMMLRELVPSSLELEGEDGKQRTKPRAWRRARARTILDAWPALGRAQPRVAHIELVFDNTCRALRELLPSLSERDAARRVGLWMAAETQGEINLRHLEGGGEGGNTPPPRAARPGAAGDEALFGDTVRRLRELRPWLSEAQAVRAVEHWVGARQLEPKPLFVPPEWGDEVRLQQRRLAVTEAHAGGPVSRP